MLNSLSEDELDNIETNLAEKIISEYKQEKLKIKENRYEFLKKKCKQTGEDIADKDY